MSITHVSPRYQISKSTSQYDLSHNSSVYQLSGATPELIGKDGSTASYSSAVQAVLNRFTGSETLTAAEILKVVAFVDGLVADGIWSLLDEFWWSKGIETEAKSLIGFKGYALTKIGTPTWDTTNGWGTFAASKYYSTNYIPSVNGVNYTLDSAMIGCWGSAHAAGYWMGSSDANARVSIITNNNNNVNGVASLIGNTGAGLATTVRLSSTSFKTYKNGAEANSSSGVSTSLVTTPITIGGMNSGGYAANIYCALIGAGVGVDQATLYSRINTLLT